MFFKQAHAMWWSNASQPDSAPYFVFCLLTAYPAVKLFVCAGRNDADGKNIHFVMTVLTYLLIFTSSLFSSHNCCFVCVCVQVTMMQIGKVSTLWWQVWSRVPISLLMVTLRWYTNFINHMAWCSTARCRPTVSCWHPPVLPTCLRFLSLLFQILWPAYTLYAWSRVPISPLLCKLHCTTNLTPGPLSSHAEWHSKLDVCFSSLWSLLSTDYGCGNL